MPISYPCSVCCKNVLSDAVFCDHCNQWVHKKCNYLSEKEFQDLIDDDETKPFCCIKCFTNNLAFSNTSEADFYCLIKCGTIIDKKLLDKSDLKIIESQDYLKKLNNHLSQAYLSPEEESNDNSSPVNCNYYTPEEFVNSNFQSSRSFSVYHVNIHSIIRHIDTLRCLLVMLNFTFDILLISESKLQKDVDSPVDITIPGYQKPVSVPTEANKGGVLIYVREGLNFKPRTDLQIYAAKALESCFIEIINPGRKPNDIVGTMYRHPSTMEPQDFNENYLRPLIDKLMKESNKDIYLGGDFNLDLIKASEHEETSEFLDIMTSNFLLPTISLPTKINKKHDTLIDNIFSNKFNPDILTGNLTVEISDHLSSFAIFPKENQNHLPKKHNCYKREMANFKKENFMLDILEIDWMTTVQPQENDANKSFDNFYNTLSRVIDKHMPLRKITKKEYKQKFKPWITSAILRKMRQRDKLFKIYVRLKNHERKNDIRAQYRKLRNDILQMVRTSKKNFYKNYFENNNKNLRKVWQGIKQIINIKSKLTDIPTCISSNDNLISCPKEISNKFNEYFSNIAGDILKGRKYEGYKEGYGDYMSYMPDPEPDSIFLHAVSSEDIFNIIMKFDDNKGTGPCSIPSKILKMISLEIAEPLSWIANICFSTGVHPDKLKIAKIIPIYKKGSKLQTCNYRPISLLSNLNKIFEKLIFNKVYKFLDQKGTIYDLQYGFRPKHSTTHALINITERIRESLDQGKVACGIFVDLQKAFDTVNHDILLDKMHRYGIRGSASKWFKSYLSNRYQYVSLQGFDSNRTKIEHGVPQGSVLGPLLFLIYINDLPKAIKHSFVYLFADDTNMLKICDSYKLLQKQINHDLKGLYLWLLANKISLNATKTELIIFRKEGKKYEIPIDLRIKINGQRLYPTHSIKYLGIYLDEYLKGTAHILNLQPKLRRANGMLSKIRHYTLPHQLASIYHSIFASHMTYGCQIWGLSPTNTYIEKIQVLQNDALRRISFAPDFRDHVTPIYIKLNLLKIKDLITLKNLLLIHDYFNKKLPKSFDNYFILDKDKHLYELEEIRATKIPDKFNDYVFTESQMNPQENPIPGQLYKPEYETVKYGRNSLKITSINYWNHLNRKYYKSNKKNDFIAMSRNKFKNLVVKDFLKGYEELIQN